LPFQFFSGVLEIQLETPRLSCLNRKIDGSVNLFTQT
jgi:hypothetical protein